MPPKGEKKVKEETTEDKTDLRAQQPDKAEFDEQVAKIQKVIDDFQKRQKELSKKISEENVGKNDENYQERMDLKHQLEQLQARIQELEGARKLASDKLDEGRQNQRNQRQELEKMKKFNGFKNEDEIDDRIASIEFKMWTGSMSLNEEKACLREISDLKKLRPQVTRVKAKEAQMSNQDFGTEHKENIELVKDQLNQYRDARKVVADRLHKLNQERSEAYTKVSHFVQERKQISEQITAKIEERNQLREAFREKERAYQQLRRAAQEERYQREAEERAARDLKRKEDQFRREADKLDLNPHQDMITLIDQTLTYCKSLCPEDNDQQQEKKQVVHDLGEGLTILARKEEREDEFFYVATAKKKSKGKSSAKKEGPKMIKHNAMTFGLFDKLGLNAPMNTGDVPALIEELKGKMSEFEEKTREWQATKEEKRRELLEKAEGIAAPAAAAAAVDEEVES